MKNYGRAKYPAKKKDFSVKDNTKRLAEKKKTQQRKQARAAKLNIATFN